MPVLQAPVRCADKDVSAQCDRRGSSGTPAWFQWDKRQSRLEVAAGSAQGELAQIGDRDVASEREGQLMSARNCSSAEHAHEAAEKLQAAGISSTEQKSSGAVTAAAPRTRRRSTSLASKDAAAAATTGNHALHPWDKEKGRGRATSRHGSNAANARKRPLRRRNKDTAAVPAHTTTLTLELQTLTSHSSLTQRPRSSPALATPACTRQHAPPRNACSPTHDATAQCNQRPARTHNAAVSACTIR